MQIITDISYGIIPVFKDKNKYLFLLVRHKDGHWGFPKGHPIEKEAPTETARREIFEETGIEDCVIENGVSFEEKYDFEEENKKINKTVVYFLGFIENKKTITPQNFQIEIPEIKWVDYNNAIKLLTHAEAKKILKQANKYLTVLNKA